MIKKIFEESTQSQDEDLFRIPDIINSLDKKQIESKKWLVDTLAEYYTGNDTFIIGGGWYGLLSHLIRMQWPEESLNITSGDIDPRCEEFGWKLFHNSDINFVTEDMTSRNLSEYSAIISTSCEHIEPQVLKKFIKSKHDDAWVVLQTNNYYELDSHINCYGNVMSFAIHSFVLLLHVFSRVSTN